MADPGLVFKIVLISTLVFALILLSVEGAPADLQNEEVAKNCTNEGNASNVVNDDNDFDEIIDQSQNATRANIRVNINDILVVWAPVNTLLAATGLLDSQLSVEDFLESGDLSELNKPDSEDNHPLIIDFMENKPNSTLIVSSGNDTEKPVLINPTTKPAILKRSGLNYPALLGPFLRRKH